jgi:hypothetical protein
MTSVLRNQGTNPTRPTRSKTPRKRGRRMRNGGGCVESSLAFVWLTGRADGDGRGLGD